MLKPLPLLLAGPMVRRATTDAVHFWFITTKAIENPEVRLYDIADLSITSETLNTEPVVLGASLFLYLLKVQPGDGAFLPHDEVIFYDIGEGVEGVPDNFISLIDEIAEQVIHPEYKLPSFILQTGSENQLRALYGSCRKLHGPGQDMMRKADAVISEHYDDVGKRPRVIFLGGDQVYADDVSPKLIKEINRLGRLLIGSGNKHNEGVYFKGDRQPTLSRLGFTSTHMHQHLASLGEFIATYLLAWNGSLWDHIRFTVDRRPNEEEAGREGAYAARFVFANCISYMIFDDHEITDDWNFDPKWEKYVYGLNGYSDPDTKANKGGGTLANIIAHGLGAFWIFQAYGNNPDDYPDQFKQTVSDYALKGLNQAKFLETLIGFHKWSFIAPTSPPALFVDTRTQRFHHKTEGEQIINYEAINRLRNLVNDHVSSILKPLIVMVPTPFFDIDAKEFIQSSGKKKRNRSNDDMDLPNLDSATKNDAEGFAIYLASLKSLLILFAQKKVQPLVVLCGDVHYAFEQTFEYEYSRHRVVAVQLCSSSLKNQPLGGEIDKLDAAELSDTLIGTGRPSLNDRDNPDDDAAKSLPQYLGALKDSGKVVRYNPPKREYGKSGKEETQRRIKIRRKVESFHHYVKLYSNINKSDDYGKYLWKNNIGEFVISSNKVKNRYHYDKAVNFKTTSEFVWHVHNWPIVKAPD